jgi:hypothetical protein
MRESRSRRGRVALRQLAAAGRPGAEQSDANVRANPNGELQLLISPWAMLGSIGTWRHWHWHLIGT